MVDEKDLILQCYLHIELTKALAMEVARIVRDGQLLGGDDSSYQVAYLLHALYLLALPAFHVLRGELSMGSLTDVLRFQLVGTALAAFFYVVLVTQRARPAITCRQRAHRRARVGGHRHEGAWGHRAERGRAFDNRRR